MSWFRASKASTKPDYTGLQLQTSVNTLPVPIVWGQTKAAANVIWYQNFQTQGGGGGGKGGLFGSPGASTYTYTADLIMALCEGPISGIGIIWKDQSTYTIAQLGLSLFNGTTPQAVWGYLSSKYPAQALAYQGTCYVCAASYQLGDNANIGNHNFEILGALAGSGVNGVDADPALVVNDFLTNAQYGAGFSAASIDATTLFGSGGDASLQTYCKAMGLAFSPALVDQEQGSSILSRWLQILNCGAVWSGGQLKFIPFGDAAVAAGDVARTVQFPVPTPAQASSGVTPPPSITVCPPAQFVADGGVTYAFTGGALAYIGAIAPSGAGSYGLSPEGTYLFAAGDEDQVVSITYTYAIPTSYVPDLTPVYNLTDSDFVDEKGNTDPVQAARLDPFSLPTIQRVECLSRANQYGATPVEARDQSQIELYGPRVGSTIQAHEICDEVNIGPIVAQTILQRGLYVRARFTFKLSWEYGLLDPMDIVTITDANLGLANYPVRITTIEEDDKGLLTVTAEELTVGVSTPALYPNNGPSGFLPNQAVAVSPVNTPLIWEPPPALTGGASQIWAGASGGSGGVADPNWGGAAVWVSLDDVTYSQIATITQALRQGVLTAALTQATGWDSADTLSVNLSESGGALTGTSLVGAQNGATRSLVDGELLSYESATLVAPNAYNLTGLQRGIYGTASSAHAAGAPFARLDSAVVSYTLPANYIGQTLYFKFQSFNVFGGGSQSLAACAVYSYIPSGGGDTSPIAAQLESGFPVDLGLVSIPSDVADDFGNLSTAPAASLDLGNLTS
jgi:hypothetical protein